MVDRASLFWKKVKKTEGGCWEWAAAKGPYGYGYFSIGNGRAIHAHRVSYELAYGPIPAGLHIDHLCRNKGCVNPAHLEAVTQKENTLRGIGLSAQNAKKTHCKYGHPLNEENTRVYMIKNGKRKGSVQRECKICLKRRLDEWNAKVKAERIPVPPKAFCKHGHPFDESNTYHYKDAQGHPKRACKTCRTSISKRRTEKVARLRLDAVAL